MTIAAKANPPARARRAAKAPANFYKANTWVREESIAYLMGRSFSLMKEAVDDELEPSGLTHAQWVPLFKLYQNEASTVAELGRTCQVDAGAMTRTLDRLETKGLVQRVRSSEDRRVVRLQLTQEGRETAKAIPAALSRSMNAFLAGFSHEEWQQLKGLLARVLANAEELQQEREGRDSE